jgi:hypothetical protein
MQRLEVSGAVQPIEGSLGVKGLQLFRDFIGRIGMRPGGWRVDFSDQCYYAQSNSVSFSEVGLFCALCQGAVLQSFTVLCAQKNS